MSSRPADLQAVVRALAEAAQADDSDYNPAEFELRLMRQRAEISTRAWWRDLPASQPPAAELLTDFVDRLEAANRTVALEFLR